MPTQYDILKYLQKKGGEETISNLYKKFGVTTGKKMKFLKNAGMVEIIRDEKRHIIKLTEGITDTQIESKKPTKA